MIHEVVPVIAAELNDFLESQFDTGEDKVIISNLVNQDGSVAIQDENKVVVSIINIERDGNNQRSFAKLGSNPSVNINIYILFSAYFNSSNYLEALKFISGVIAFFQSKNVFTPSNTPMLNNDIHQIVAEMVNIDFKELSNLWGALGGKYLPSVVYRFRSINIDEDLLSDEIPDVGGLVNL